MGASETVPHVYLLNDFSGVLICFAPSMVILILKSHALVRDTPLVETRVAPGHYN